MVRKLLRSGVFALMGVIGMVASYGAALSANAADAEISEVMKKSFGKDGFKATISAAAKGEKWEDAAKSAKAWNELAMALGKNTPPKGDGKAWEAECKKFCESTKAILDAAEKKDSKALKTAMSFNCMGCHKAHKGQ